MHMGLLEAYESASGGILDTIADMQSKAEESLSSTRKDEMEAAHAFALLKQGLEDEIKVNKKQLGEATLTRSKRLLCMFYPHSSNTHFRMCSDFSHL